MGLPKGKTNNKKGRPKGSLNTANKDLREIIGEIIRNELTRADSFIENLDPRDRMKFLIELMPYSIPKIDSIPFDQVNKKDDTESLIDKINKQLSLKNSKKKSNGASDTFDCLNSEIDS